MSELLWSRHRPLLRGVIIIKTKFFRKEIALFLAVCIFATTLFSAKSVNASETNTGSAEDVSDNSADSLVEDAYANVTQMWQEQGIVSSQNEEYLVNPRNEMSTGSVVEAKDSFDYGQDVLMLETGDTLEFNVEVKKSGLYAVAVNYYCLSEKAVDHTISLKINDKYLFSEARELVLEQYYECEEYPFRKEASGDEITPDTYIRKGWEKQILKSINQSQTDALLFYFEQGSNKVRITMEKSSILLGEISITSPKEVVDYESYLKQYPEAKSEGMIIEQEAERISYKNTTESRPIATRDVETVPYTRNTKLMSVIGGETWKSNGQTLFYQIEVKKTGWYYIGLKCKQNDKDNTTVYRTITLDGELPYREAAQIPIRRDSKWEIETLTQDEEPLKFYLEEGTHVIGIEVDSSMMNGISSTIQEKIDEISSLSVEIKKIIGNNEDEFRDYDILTYLPELVDDMEAIASDLDVLLEEMILWNQGYKKNANISNMQIAINQLRKLAKEPDEIPNNIAMFSEGSGSVSQLLGNVLDSIKEAPLELDAIYLYEEGAELPEYKTNIFEKFVEEFLFFIDDLLQGSQKETEEGNVTEEITVWVNRANTYVNQMQTMADTMFTPETGIKVNFELMKDEGKLILANTTDTQPDVALGLSAYLPYDLAIRGAVTDLRQFDDFNELAQEFNSGAFLTHTYNDGIYAMPETQDFYVLFYRKDLIEAMNIQIPDTWEDVLEVLPQLQRFGMNFYVPLASSVSFKTSAMTTPYILQYGGDIYEEDGMSVAVNNAEGLEAMKFMTNLFVIYGMPTEVADFYQSFRSGIIPMGVSNFSTYLRLESAAAELAGKWDIALMPGVKNEEGEVERWSTGAGTAGVIFEKSEKKGASWEFLKWWMSAETQAEFGTQMQLLFGETYMWNTANMEAFVEMPLDEQDKDVIMEQWKWLHEYIKTPAGYMVERELSNVWNKIVFDGENARSALDDAAITMNQEIERKMEEFGMTKYHLPSIDKIESWVNGDE